MADYSCEAEDDAYREGYYQDDDDAADEQHEGVRETGMTIWSSDTAFMCRLVDWLNDAEADNGSTRIVLLDERTRDQ